MSVQQAVFPPQVRYLLAGLETGMLGGLLSLAWYVVSSLFEGQWAWIIPSRLGAIVLGEAAIRKSFPALALSGAAFHLALAGALGAFFGIAIGVRAQFPRVLLFGLLFALGCYYAAYFAVWRLGPALAHSLISDRSVLVASLLFGAHLGRYPGLLEALRKDL